MNVEGFVAQHLPQPRSRVLEVGCGSGELARNLVTGGHHVMAIDPHAPTGSIFRQVSLEDFEEEGPFDAVIANRSLHHIENLSAALEKVVRLLTPSGRLILNEFAFDQMNLRTAEWFSARAEDPPGHDQSSNAHEFLNQWKTEHAGLHDSTTLREALDTFFQTELFEWVPYLALYRLDRSDLVEEEIRSIRSGEINPIGFQYVGLPG